jgi:hypothetical protein
LPLSKDWARSAPLHLWLRPACWMTHA